MSIDPTVQWPVRHDWTPDDVVAVIERPFHDLLADAQHVHRRAHIAHAVEGAMLLSIKTGGCPEDCAYCPQSAKYAHGTRAAAADGDRRDRRRRRERARRRARPGSAWARRGVRRATARSSRWPTPSRQCRALGLETCVTLGMLTDRQQARLLAGAGLDYYNHNLDTSPEFYGEIITTRTYDDRLDTLRQRARRPASRCAVAASSAWARAGATEPGCSRSSPRLDPHPESVPINLLVQVPGTPLFGTPDARLVRAGAHDRRRPAGDAGVGRSPVGRTHRDERRAAGAVPARRGQQHLPRRPAADDAQPRRRRRSATCSSDST